MTPEHKSFIAWLEKLAPITAAVLEEHWSKGEKFLMDSRVDIRGKRREFNRLNKVMEDET